MAQSTLQFDVPDTNGQAAVSAITEALRKIDPRTDIHVYLITKLVLIGALIDGGRAAEAIEAAGFSVKAAG